MVKGDPTTFFFVVLIKRAVAVMAVIPYGLMVVPVFLGEYCKGVSFLFIYRKEKRNLIIGMPKGRWVHQTLV